jgi:hypothetical protein
MEMKLEVVVVPVSDVDRAKGFYERLGWRLDGDFVTGEDFRVVQFTPPGSQCSIIIGKGVTSAEPGSVQDLQLTVFDIEPPAQNSSTVASTWVRCSTTRVACSTTGAPRAGYLARPRTTPTMARSPRSAIRTATAGCSKRSRHGFPDADDRGGVTNGRCNPRGPSARDIRAP